MQLKMAELQDRAAERANKLQVAEIERQTEQVRLAQTLAIHADKTEQAERALQYKFEESAQNREHNWALEQMRGERDIEDADMDRAAELHRMHTTTSLEEQRRAEEAERAEAEAERQRQIQLEDEERAHQRQLELHARKESTAVKLAKMKPKPKPAAAKKKAKK
jgi:colicin import membrane protein